MRKVETQIELHENFVPNSNLEYDIFFNEKNGKFKAVLTDSDHNKGCVGYDKAPKTVIYSLVKPLNEFTDDEKQEILDYRGLKLEIDGFEPIDIFMHSGYTKLIGILVKIQMEVETFILPEEQECADDILSRMGDIYLHSAGDKGWEDKEDLGGDIEIKFV